ncbi:MAG: 2-phospho-L-lactate/phosphoenolpyruvate guanylyltransferase [Sphingomonadales bacterium]|jgi:2-phospho-L-lactate guanylyltransferase|nr:2-phospho-L-lactate/phosphoenolpyruvate guanylyltransferase [Sphingomonadales bacterium]
MTTAIHLVIAARGGTESKRRCHDKLSPADRARLTGLMLDDMLESLGHAETIAGILVVSPTPMLLDLARAAGCDILRERGSSGLNAAFSQGAARVRDEFPDRALALLPADLPRLDGGELDRAGGLLDSASIVVAPSWDGGTGGLLMRPGISALPMFGERSFRRHVEAARGAGLSTRIFRSRGFSMDVDRPEDLESLARTTAPSRAASFLRERLGAVGGG